VNEISAGSDAKIQLGCEAGYLSGNNLARLAEKIRKDPYQGRSPFNNWILKSSVPKTSLETTKNTFFRNDFPKEFVLYKLG